MVNWNDPVTLTRDYAAVVKLLHVSGGLYIWEFFLNLDFDWEIVRGRRQYRWSFPLYIGCRFSAVLAIITLFIGFDSSSEIDCQLWVVFVFLLAYMSTILASALIVLRVVAIWNKNIPAVVLAVATWLVAVVFYVRSVVLTRAEWDEEIGSCAVLNTAESKDNIIATLVSDIVLLLLMFFGLLRWPNAGMVHGIWRLLYTQGILWIVIVTLAEVPPVAFIFLNLNAAFNLMFQVPELIIMTIGATRIYRSLADYSSVNDLQADTRFTTRPGGSTGSALVAHSGTEVFFMQPITNGASFLSQDKGIGSDVRRPLSPKLNVSYEGPDRKVTV
ncbi:hypothetical protein BV25DRAFT_597421 [Artomyces pyxidatus]|uniref:Uncharacterized protein n=1 Tax=Artomyces pyxidatus TaxID=48021 RepID=A0ACB8T1P6_9AGAM|nr:hypothetical protein BV25DRAFT_597421 [Artomyces pyxidatus]